MTDNDPLKRGSKTLDNGLQVLEVLGDSPNGLTTTELSERLSLHRTVTDRLVRTLEHHGFCRRTQEKRIVLGNGLVALANRVQQDLRGTARPILEDLAEELQVTTHLAVQETEDSVRALIVVPPRHSRIHVGFREGQVDPIDRGSAGLAIMSMREKQPGERDEVDAVRERGYAVTKGEVTPSVTGISAPVPYRNEPGLLSVGISVFEAADEAHLATTVVAAADALGRALLR
ncbi:IclR family transcriptional regulator [Corynebacterium sp.]|uniref:IclR family transcriptional regulator n=1 Tax=Corynebacterium sp. TaxID=1720 RepID=UPI003B3BDF32